MFDWFVVFVIQVFLNFVKDQLIINMLEICNGQFEIIDISGCCWYILSNYLGLLIDLLNWL